MVKDLLIHTSVSLFMLLRPLLNLWCSSGTSWIRQHLYPALLRSVWLYPWWPFSWALVTRGAVKNKSVTWLPLQMVSLLDSARNERVFISSCAGHGENFCQSVDNYKAAADGLIVAPVYEWTFLLPPRFHYHWPWGEKQMPHYGQNYSEACKQNPLGEIGLCVLVLN